MGISLRTPIILLLASAALFFGDFSNDNGRFFSVVAAAPFFPRTGGNTYHSELIDAAGRGRLEITRSLLNRGVDVHARNDRALRSAAFGGHLQVVELLISRGANIHAENDEALRLAARWNRVDVVRFLLNNGADVHAENDQALSLATERNYLEVIALLNEHGASVPASDEMAVPHNILRVADTHNITVYYSSTVPGIDRPTIMDISGNYWLYTAALIVGDPEAFASEGFCANIDKASDSGGPRRTLVDALNTYLVTGNPSEDKTRRRDPFLFMKDGIYYLEVLTSPEMAFMIGSTFGKSLQLRLALPVKIDAQLFRLLQRLDHTAISNYYDKVYPPRIDELYGELYKGFIDKVNAASTTEAKQKIYAELNDPENGICVCRVRELTLGDLKNQSNALVTSNGYEDCLGSYEEYAEQRNRLLDSYRKTFIEVLVQFKKGLAYFLNEQALEQLETLDLSIFFDPKELSNEDMLRNLSFTNCHYEIESMIPGVRITMKDALRDFVSSLTTKEQRRRLIQIFTGSGNIFLGPNERLEFQCFDESPYDRVPPALTSSKEGVEGVITSGMLEGMKQAAASALAIRVKSTSDSRDFECSDGIFLPISHTCFNKIDVSRQKQADIFCALGTDMQHDPCNYTVA